MARRLERLHVNQRSDKDEIGRVLAFLKLREQLFRDHLRQPLLPTGGRVLHKLQLWDHKHQHCGQQMDKQGQ